MWSGGEESHPLVNVGSAEISASFGHFLAGHSGTEANGKDSRMDWRSIITGRTGRIAAGVLAAAAVTPAAASAATSNPTSSLPAATPSCPTTPTFSQPFSGLGDQNWYTLAPGQAVDSFTAAGWTLTNGARTVTTTLAGGATGQVLDLPSGGVAVSPVMCVSSRYPVARAAIRDLIGAEGVSFNVEYLGTATANKPKNTGQIHS